MRIFKNNTSFTCAPTKAGRHKANKAAKRLKPKWWSDPGEAKTTTPQERAKLRKKNRMAKASRKANR